MPSKRPRARPAHPKPVRVPPEVVDRIDPAPPTRPPKMAIAPMPERGALFLCPHAPDSPLTARMVAECNALTNASLSIHFFCITLPEGLDPSVRIHELALSREDSPLEHAFGFARAFARAFDGSPSLARRLVAFGSEWTSIPALRHLQPRVPVVLSVDSMERQRSDMSSPFSQSIDEIEQQGLRDADRVIVADHPVAELARALVPDAAPKLRYARHPFPTGAFSSNLDPGQVKARYGVGPLDPVVLFVGDMNWAHGPDILVRSLPALLRNHGGVRAIFVGEGDMTWPVRVQARYMLLGHAVRVLGHREGAEVHELVAASDIIVVPSRERTRDWPILAAWAAGRPVVATHEVASGLGSHEHDTVLIYSNPGSCVWGVERVLYDPNLVHRMRTHGRHTLESRFGWPAVGAQLQSLIEEIDSERPPVESQPSTLSPMVEARP